MIKIERDIGDGNGYKTIIDWYDATQNATPPENFKFSLTGSTGSVKNYHSIDDLTINAISCGTLGQEDNETILNYKFDAWDSLTHKYISTKIVNQDFNLTIVSLDENKTNLQDFNGTVCAKVDNVIKTIKFNNENNKSASFNVNRAIKDVRVELSWKKDVDESCPLANENNETNSLNNFAIRPVKFNISITSPLIAGKEFNFDVKAQTGTTNAQGYDTNVSDINITIHDDTKECEAIDADFNLTKIAFKDGISNESARFDDVGVVDINITDKDWAKVDENDTNQSCSGSWICGELDNIKIIPSHFDINATHTNMNGTFTYLDDNLTQYSTLDINITAQNERNETTKNYTSLCYANSVNIGISHENINSDGLSKLKYIYQDGNDVNSSGEVDKNSNINLNYNRNNFTSEHNGTAPITFYINFDRNYLISTNPFDLNITNIYVKDSDNVEGNGDPISSPTFYYGRVKTQDIMTNKQNINHSLHVEVYSDSKNGYVEDFHQESLDWYRMEDDSYTSNISLSAKKDFAGNSDENDVSLNPSLLSVTDGKSTFTITNTWSSSNKAYIHVDIPEYLWYNKYNPFDSSGDCSEHPCFIYTYTRDSNDKNISSGNFKGTSIGTDFNATKTKKGVKIFR